MHKWWFSNSFRSSYIYYLASYHKTPAFSICSFVFSVSMNSWILFCSMIYNPFTSLLMLMPKLSLVWPGEAYQLASLLPGIANAPGPRCISCPSHGTVNTSRSPRFLLEGNGSLKPRFGNQVSSLLLTLSANILGSSFCFGLVCFLFCFHDDHNQEFCSSHRTLEICFSV